MYAARSYRLGRLSRPSRIPAVKVMERHVQPAPCCICGAVLKAGDLAYGRAYDLRRSCPSCPWTAAMIAEKTR